MNPTNKRYTCNAEPMRTTTYFAFGSNLDQDQMRARCPSAKLVGPAVLPGHALAFAGYSHRWGGAVATAVARRGARLQGLLYALEPGDIDALDRFEGCPFAYERFVKTVTDRNGRKRRASLYLQPDAEVDLWSPPLRYFFVLWQAYERFGFDRQALAVAARLSQ